MTEKAELETIATRDIQLGPVRHDTLPADLISRIRLIRIALWTAYPHSMKFWVEGFMRDSHPSQEVGFWEHVSAVYLEAVNQLGVERREQLQTLFWAVYSTVSDSQGEPDVSDLPHEAIKVVAEIARHSVPIYDIEDVFSQGWSESSKQDHLPAPDLENFPTDLPEDILREHFESRKNRKA